MKLTMWPPPVWRVHGVESYRGKTRARLLKRTAEEIIAIGEPLVFIGPNRRKLDALTILAERSLIRSGIGALLHLARIAEVHELLENGGSRELRGKVAIDVVDRAVKLSNPR